MLFRNRARRAPRVPRQTKPAARLPSFFPRLEALEDRRLLTTFLVTNSLDNLLPGSLRYAITQANMAGKGATVEVTSQVTSPIVLTNGELPIDVGMTIRNDSGAPVEIRQATANARVLHIGSDAATVTITGVSSTTPITLDGGSVTGANGGGILENGPTDLTLISVEVISNRVMVGANAVVGSGGGGVYAAGGSITLDGDSSVSDNQAPDGSGGGINMQGGKVVVQGGSHVDGNSAFNEGGIRVHDGVDRPGSNVVRVVGGSTVNDNSSSALVNPQRGDFGGGGIAVEDFGSVFVSDSQVSDNQTVGMYSGGIVVSVGNVTVTDGSQIMGNTNRGPGGGIAANFGGTVTVSGGSQVIGNTGAAIGGGIVNFSGPLGSVRVTGGSQVNNNILTNEETIGKAIAVFIEYIRANSNLRASAAARTALAAEDRLTNPFLLVGGGGIGTLIAPISITGGSEVNGNYCGRRDASVPTTGLGGGIFSVLSQVTVDHSAVEGNQAPYGDGGGIYHTFNLLTLDHATINGNSAAVDGGGLWSGGALLCYASTVADNTAGADGGGLFNTPHGHAVVLGSEFLSNQAAFGGGLANLGTLAVVGSTVAENQAALDGGGIFSGHRLLLIHVLFSDNSPNNVARF
jgi:hypothetical protein